MGLSIHYSGQIADKSMLPRLIEEVEEIANVHGWKYSIYERHFSEDSNEEPRSNESLLNKRNHDGKLYGIDFTPKGSEPISIAFLSNGRMSSIMQLSCWGEFKEEKLIELKNTNVNELGELEIHNEEFTLTADHYNQYLYQCSSKTQYAGIQAHEMVIGVFRYLNKNYLKDFKLIDEGHFWETGDKVLLKKTFERYTDLINGFATALSENNKKENEDLDGYLERVIREFREKNKE